MKRYYYILLAMPVSVYSASNQLELMSTTLELTNKTQPGQNIILSSPILAKFDGKAGILDADKMRGMKYIMQETIRIQYGKLDKATNTRIGCYQFQGQWCSLKKLVKIEAAWEARYGHLKAHNKAEYDKAMAPLKTLLTNDKKSGAIDDFESVTSQYMEEAKGAQYIMTQLIKESCQKRNIPHSVLLEWGKTNEGDKDSLRKTMTSFSTFDSLCTDLVNFLGDMQRSCPKAMQKYKEKYGK